MGNHFFMLFCGTPTRFVWTLVGLVVIVMMIISQVSPHTYDLIWWKFTQAMIVPLYWAGCIAVLVGVYRAIFGGKKGGGC